MSTSDPPAGGGLRLLDTRPLSDRLSHLTLFSPALGRETAVRVLLPAGYDPGGDPPLPVLWLLHGGMDDVTSWTDRGEAEARTAGLDLVVVMPEAGLGGWYSDWHEPAGPCGPLRWETHHLTELRPWVEDRYRTRADRAGRAVAGLSMGGFGALSYAARHPELFGFAAAFSGAVDILDPGIGTTAELTASAMGATKGDVWGRWPEHRGNRRARNPLDLAENLASLTLELRTGNGQPGGRHGGGDPIEAGVHGPMTRLHRRLTELGIAHVWDDYGPGGHEWPYWADDLAASLPGLCSVAASTLEPPAEIAHLAFEPTFEAWGWRVELDRPGLEPARLTTNADGFTLTGTGLGTVTTPPRFNAGATVRIHRASGTWDAAVDGDGRIRVPVDLGPGNAVDVDDRRPGEGAPAVTAEVRLTELG